MPSTRSCSPFGAVLVLAAQAALAQAPLAPEGEASYRELLVGAKAIKKATAEDLKKFSATADKVMKALDAAGVESTKPAFGPARNEGQPMGDLAYVYSGVREFRDQVAILGALGLTAAEIRDNLALTFESGFVERREINWNGTTYPLLKTELAMGIVLPDEGRYEALLACPLAGTAHAQSRIEFDPKRYRAGAEQLLQKIKDAVGAKSFGNGLSVIEPPSRPQQQAKPKRWDDPESAEPVVQVRYVAPTTPWPTKETPELEIKYQSLRLWDSQQLTLTNCGVLIEKYLLPAIEKVEKSRKSKDESARAEVLEAHRRHYVLYKLPLHREIEPRKNQFIKTLVPGEPVEIVEGLKVVSASGPQLAMDPRVKVSLGDGTAGYVDATVTLKWRTGKRESEEEVLALSEGQPADRGDLGRTIANKAVVFYQLKQEEKAQKRRGSLATEMAESAGDEEGSPHDDLCKARAIYAMNFGAPAVKGLIADIKVALEDEGWNRQGIDAIVKTALAPGICTP